MSTIKSCQKIEIKYYPGTYVYYIGILPIFRENSMLEYCAYPKRKPGNYIVKVINENRIEFKVFKKYKRKFKVFINIYEVGEK